MGCATGLASQLQINPKIHGWILYKKDLLARLEQLRPSALIPVDKLQKIVQKYRNDDIKDEVKIEKLQLSTSDRQRWLSLVLCSNMDLYDHRWPQQQNFKPHQSFLILQKDLTRTFSGREEMSVIGRTEKLQRVLKHFCLYFPAVGYTQGLNYITGYLLMLGFEQDETFWLIVHLALHPEFILLGMFEEGFPLAIVYCNIFHKVLEKHRPKLQNWLKSLNITDDLWLFKWFLTYFLYSFPLEKARILWDFILVMGGIGIIKLAIAILQRIRDKCSNIEQAFDLVDRLEQLKQQDGWNNIINDTSLILQARMIQITNEDVRGSAKQIKDKLQNSNKSSFYVDYLCSNKDVEMHSKWLQKMRESRQKFSKKTSKSNSLKRCNTHRLFQQTSSMSNQRTFEQHIEDVELPDLSVSRYCKTERKMQSQSTQLRTNSVKDFIFRSDSICSVEVDDPEVQDIVIKDCIPPNTDKIIDKIEQIIQNQ